MEFTCASPHDLPCSALLLYCAALLSVIRIVTDAMLWHVVDRDGVAYDSHTMLRAMRAVSTGRGSSTQSVRKTRFLL
jgi:hypothetical protein